LSLCHKLKCYNSYIFATCWCKLLKFQTLIIWSNIIYSLEYLRSITLGCKIYELKNLILWHGLNSFNLKSELDNLASSASPIECLLYLPNVRAIQYKLGPKRLTRLGNSNVLRLPLIGISQSQVRLRIFSGRTFRLVYVINWMGFLKISIFHKYFSYFFWFV